MIESSNRELIVVFGGAGYIGSCLVRQLLEEGYAVRCFDNYLYGSSGIDDIDDPHFEAVFGDICDIKAVSYACKDADGVILLAAIVGHRTQDSNRATYRDVNYFAPSTVLDAAREHGASRFIFASTNSVYGIQSGLMYETTTPAPVSFYSRLKLRIEERVIRAKRRTFHPTALRLATCYGSSRRMRFDLVANSLVRDAYFRKEIVLQSGEQSRALLHVEDAARSFVLCLKAHENLISGEVFNVGANEQSYQIHYLANYASRLVPGSTVVVEPSEPDLVDYHLACSKIEKILDFRPEKNVEDAMKEMVSSFEAGEFPDPFHIKYQCS